MADLTHSTLISNQVHEPKHITSATSASAGHVITPSAVNGVSELRALTLADIGADPQYGSMYLVNNQTPKTLVAALDPNLYDPTDFSQVLQSDASFLAGVLYGVEKNSNTNELIINESGIYSVKGYVDFNKDSPSDGDVGFRFTINGVTVPDMATARTTLVGGNNSDKKNIAASNIIYLAQGDFLGVSIAAELAGDYVLLEGNLNINLIHRPVV